MAACSSAGSEQHTANAKAYMYFISALAAMPTDGPSPLEQRLQLLLAAMCAHAAQHWGLTWAYEGLPGRAALVAAR